MTLHPITPDTAIATTSTLEASARLTPEHGEPIRVIAPDVLEVIGLFMDGPLSDVTFPEVDAVTFEVLIDDAREVAQQVANLRHQLAHAREALVDAQAVLAKRATKALAYAKVYAATDETLSARLAETQLARKEEAQKKKPRRRRRSTKAAEPKTTTVELDLPLSAAG